MIIIVDGIDRVGKSTLIEKLEKELDIPVFKRQGSFCYEDMDNDNETDKMLQILKVLEITGQSMIFDRFHWSDYVYGIIERGYDYTKAGNNFMNIEIYLKHQKVSKVCLIKMEPTNLKESSTQHGKDLSRYELKFEELYQASLTTAIKPDAMTSRFEYLVNCNVKIKSRYDLIDDTVRLVKSLHYCEKSLKEATDAIQNWASNYQKKD